MTNEAVGGKTAEGVHAEMRGGSCGISNALRGEFRERERAVLYFRIKASGKVQIWNQSIHLAA